MARTSNWYNELQELLKDDEFHAIRIHIFGFGPEDRNYYFQSPQTLEDAKTVLDYDFDSGYGGTEGPSFVMWTKKYIYFAVCYDGAEWIDCVPRNPDSAFKPWHFGGG